MRFYEDPVRFRDHIEPAAAADYRSPGAAPLPEPEQGVEEIEAVDGTDPEDHVIRAGGLSSGVTTGEEDGVHGHILMADYDDCEDVYAVIEELESAPGISVLLRSSPGSYHGYNLSVRPLDTQVFHALRGASEPAHVRSSARRGYFVLRWTAKLFDGDLSPYKPAPEPVGIWLSDPEGHPQSEPHLELIEDRLGGWDAEILGNPEALRDARERYDMIGSGCRVDYYRSATDPLKEAIRSGEPMDP